MFMKDEAAGQKNLRVVSPSSLFGEGAWASEPSAPLTGAEPVEGPVPLVRDGQLLLLFDKYAGGGLGALRSRDLVALTDVASWKTCRAPCLLPPSGMARSSSCLPRCFAPSRSGQRNEPRPTS